MAKARTSGSSNTMKTRRPPISPEAKENQMIALAMDLVEQRLLDGTASSSETVHFLKMGSMKHQREMEKLEEENKLLRAKTEALESSKEVKELYENALKAMRNYAGQGDPDEYEDY
jgi:ribosomal protein S2